MAAASRDDITKIAKEALYVTVGLGVIAFQKAQVQRNELQRSLKGRGVDAKGGLDSVSKLVDERVKLVEERLGGIEDRIEALLDRVESRLPEQAREISKQARTAAKDARTQVRSLIPNAS